jgi:ketopantoate reductase
MCAQASPSFSLLSEALDVMKMRLLDFLVVLFVLVIFFALQAIFMFGRHVDRTHTHTHTKMSLDLMFGRHVDLRENQANSQWRKQYPILMSHGIASMA